MKNIENRRCPRIGRKGPLVLKSGLELLRRLGAAAVIAATALACIPATQAAIPSSAGWYAMPQTQLSTVCPPNNFGGTTYSFSALCPQVVAAWNSGVMDTTRNRLIVWGGGHNDYAGNELYAVNLNDQSIQRLTNPGVPTNAGGACTVTTLPDGTPNSRHTYDGLVYMSQQDKMFVFGGSPACAAGGFSNDTWVYDFATSSWQKKNPTGTIPNATPGAVTAYDPATGLVFLHDDSGLYSYDLALDRYTRLASDNIDYHLSAVIDPVRKKLVLVGNGQAWAYDIGPGSAYIRQTLSTTGGSAIVSSPYPGLAYDPVSDRIVGWNGGNTVYSLNLTTNTWTPTTFAGGPGQAQQNGTYKRWSYSPASGVFVLVNSMTQNAYTLRLGSAPASDTTPDAFTFTPQTNVAVSTAVTSNAITVSGIDAASPISVSGGSYSIGGAAFATAPGTVVNGNSVRVQLTSSASPDTQTCATLTIGGVNGPFCATTLQPSAGGDDTTPDAFSFTPQTGVALNATVTSGSVTISGIDAASPISIAGGTFAINNGPFGSAATTVTNGNTVAVQLVSAATNNTQTCATLTVGGVAGQFCATTQAAVSTGSGARFTLTAAAAQTLAPFTVGLGFKKGDVTTPVLDIPDYQVVVMRRWNDGSVKHAIASGHVSLSANTAKTITASHSSTPRTGTNLTATNIQTANPQASMAFGAIGTVNLSSLLATPFRTFVSGPEMVEAHYRGQVGSDPTLVAWFHVRLYKGGKLWIRAVAENGYLDVTTQNKSYVPTVTIGGTQVWNNGGASLTHYANTRWTQEAWIGGDPQIAPQHDTAYLKSARLVPNFLAATADATALNALYQTYAPNQNGNWTASMGDTGYQDQIGLLPVWDALYIASGGDQRAYRSVVANAKAINSYPIAWADSATKLPVKPSDRPNWSLDGPNQGGSNSRAAGSLTWEIAHHGSGGYLAYLITGDYFHLETMENQMATAYLMVGPVDWSVTPSGPNLGTSRYFNGQTRAYAWVMRTLSQYVGIAPAGDAIAADYGTLLSRNIQHLKALKDTVVPAGIGYVYEYDASLYGAGLVAPWQQHFFVQALGMGSDLEPLAEMAAFNDLRDYMYRGAVGILGDSSGFCFTQASIYNLKSNAGTGVAPNGWYKTWTQVYTATFPTPPACANTLVGTSGSDPAIAARGYWGNLIPAIAYAVDHGAAGASAAWSRLTGATNWNTVLQSGFERTPTWGVVPRGGPPPVVTDTVPDAFSFASQSNAPLSSTATSAAITVAGIDAPSPISITGGTYSVNGGAYTAAASNVTVGNTVTVQLTTGSTNGTQTCATLTIGGVSGQFCATTLAAAGDTTPDPFSFTEVFGVATNATITSETITIGGIDAASPISVTGGTYDVGGGYTASAGTVVNGTSVTVRLTSAATGSTRSCATLTVGGVSAPFCGTTAASAPTDTTTDAFANTPQTNVALNTTITSNAITVAGINAPSPISIVGGTYSVNGGLYTKNAGNVSVGNTVRLRLTSSNKRATQLCATLTIGGVAGAFCVTTTADPKKSVTINRLGTGSGTVVADVGQIDCGNSCSGAFTDGATVKLTAIPDANSRFVGWLGPCTGAGCEFTVRSMTLVVASFAAIDQYDDGLDIDANGVVDPATDGALILRYLLGRPRTEAMTHWVGPGAERSSETEIADYLDDIRPMLDIDGDGETDAATDGMLILRYISGVRGAELIDGAIGPNATYTTAAEIEARIGSLIPPPAVH
jgi:hypothetical protein